MKYIITLLLCFHISTVMGQKTYTFSINDADYQIEEQKLNDLFGVAFDKLVESRVANEKAFDLWRDSFFIFKSMAYDGKFSWEVYNKRVARVSFTGGSSEYRESDHGLYNGKSAKGNPNNRNGHASRVAYINGMLGREITSLYFRDVIK